MTAYGEVSLPRVIMPVFGRRFRAAMGGWMDTLCLLFEFPCIEGMLANGLSGNGGSRQLFGHNIGLNLMGCTVSWAFSVLIS